MVSLPIILVILISTNPPQNIPQDGITPLAVQNPELRISEDEKNIQNIHSKVNDLIPTEIHFPEIPPKVKAEEEKKTQEKEIQEQKEIKVLVPNPLYTLVKNICGEGYTMDENGVCQKAIIARNGKRFDSERRRKRFIDSQQVTMDKNKNQNSDLEKTKGNGGAHDKVLGRILLKCGGLYSGLLPDGAGGCSKQQEAQTRPIKTPEVVENP